MSKDSITPNEVTGSKNMKELMHPVDRESKSKLLSHLISSQNRKQLLVFTRTKHGANRLTKYLEKNEITAAAIHGNNKQAGRTTTLSKFKEGSICVLVVADMAVNDLGLDQLSHIVNFELPLEAEDYLNRISGLKNEGEVVSLVCVDEHKLLEDIEQLIKHELPKVEIAGFEPDPTIKPVPIAKGRSSSPKERFSSNEGNRGNHLGPQSRKSNSLGNRGGGHENQGFAGKSRSSGGKRGS
ncbi:MAG: ATP-dependent RNA helicase RhlE [Chlamydiales bacterium]|jgi:ATP-dependent RNA helicase RhlE